MNKKFKPSVLLFLLLLSIGANAAVSSSENTTELTLSIGNLCEYIGKIQTDDKGSKNVCSFTPQLSSSLDFSLTPAFILSPQIGATLPKSGRDKNITTMTMFALINAKYKTYYMNFIIGTGFYFTRISGKGGEEVLNNGNGTESFPLPEEAVYSRNVVLNLGGSYDFNKEWSAELYTYVFNIESSLARAFTAGVTVTYHFGEIQ